MVRRTSESSPGVIDSPFVNIQRQDYAGRYTIFSKVNFSLEELGKLIAKL